MPKKYKTKMQLNTATKKLQAFMDRAKFWNENYSKYYRITDVVLLGSLARKENKVSDIDLCVKVERVQGFGLQEHLSRYLAWRKDVLGYAVPVDFGAQISSFESDVTRYLKAKDGRYDVLRWRELAGLSLTLDPQVTLIRNGIAQYESAELAIEEAASISQENALSLIEDGAVSREDVYWESYCNALSKFPSFVRDAILERDESQQEYLSFVEERA